MSFEELQKAVYLYLDELESTSPPFTCTMWFREVSYAKSACREILDEIELSQGLPFIVTAEDILKSVKRRYDPNVYSGTVPFSASVGLSTVNRFLKTIEERKEWKQC